MCSMKKVAGSLTSFLDFHLLSDLGNINSAVSLFCNCPLLFVFKSLFYQILRDTNVRGKKCVLKDGARNHGSSNNNTLKVI